ncbi:MAG: heparinase II/III family protein, partial [Oscillospiraceae bacterium]|nr:heparinase II/III family protein [Oscillospiraceae bacterium]
MKMKLIALITALAMLLTLTGMNIIADTYEADIYDNYDYETDLSDADLYDYEPEPVFEEPAELSIEAFAAPQTILPAYDGFFARFRFAAQPLNGPVIQLDATGRFWSSIPGMGGFPGMTGGACTRRVGFVRFDLSDFRDNLDAIDSIMLRVSTNTDSVNIGPRDFRALLLPNDLADYPSEPMSYARVQEIGLLNAASFLYRRVGNFATNTVYTTTDILPQIRAQFEENPESSFIAIRLDLGRPIITVSTSGGTVDVPNNNHQNLVLHGTGAANEEQRPSLIVNKSQSNSVLIAADNIIREQLGTAVSSNITLPSTVTSGGETANITWTSLTPSVISNAGVITRPGANAANAEASLRATVSHGGQSMEFIYSLTVLRTGSVAGNATRNADEMDLEFNVPGASAGFLLQIPSQALRYDREYVIFDASGNEIARAARDMGADYTSVNVSGYVSGSQANFTLAPYSGSLSSARGNDTFILEGISSSVNTVDAALVSALGDLSAVTENLSLPTSVGGATVRWETSNREVISSGGQVTRQFNRAGDIPVTLTAIAQVGGVTYRRAFLATVLRRDTSRGVIQPLYDPMHLTDEDFFGSWNPFSNSWGIEPMLRYDLFPDLRYVEEAVKAGDYELARVELLEYYRNRTDVPTPPPPVTTGGDMRNFLISEMWRDMAVTFLEREAPLALVEVDTDWQWHTVELHGMNVIRDNSLWLFSSNNDGSYVEIHSKENPSGNVAYLEITVDGIVRRFPATHDVHISAGTNSNINFGDAEILLSRESTGGPKPDGTPYPFGTDTFRPYFMFDNRGITGNVTRVRLRFYARSSEGTNRVFVMSRNNLPDIDENTFTWVHPTHVMQVVSFREIGWWWPEPDYRGFQGAAAPGAVAPTLAPLYRMEYEWPNGISRMVETSQMIARYRLTRDNELGFRSVHMHLGLYDIVPRADFSRILDASWRTQHMYNVLFGTMNSSFMTPEMFTTQIKFARRHAEPLVSAGESIAANQTMARRLALLRTQAFTPEFNRDGWWEHTSHVLRRMYSLFMLNPDGSFVEGTSGYMIGVSREMLGIMQITTDLLGETHPDAMFFTDAYRRFTRYMMGLMMPNGGGPRWGSSNEIQWRTGFLTETNTLNPDPWIEYVITQGNSGERPPFLSIAFMDKPNAALRDGWGNYNMAAFISNAYMGSHFHRGDLGLDVYAFGHPLLVEAGGTHYGHASPMFWSVRWTASHNTIQVNNRDHFWQPHSVNLNNPAASMLQWPQRLDMLSNSMFDTVHVGTAPNVPLAGTTAHPSGGLAPAGSGRIWPGMDINRKVTFIHNGFWIVSDFIYAPTGTNTFRQIWHADTHTNIGRPTIDSTTGIFRTDFGPGRPNIQVIPADPGSFDTRLNEPLGGQGHYSNPHGATHDPIRLWRNHTRYGETPSYYVTYVRENVAGHQTFDAVLFPDRPGNRTHVEVTRIPLDVSTMVATSLRIEMGRDTGIYYSSNEVIPGNHSNYAERFAGSALSYRAFGEFSTDGSMAYIQKDLNEEITFIALTHATRLNHNGQELVSFNGTR